MPMMSMKELAEMDRCPRAYGFEVGRGHELVPSIVPSEDNPFLDPNWRDRVTVVVAETDKAGE